MEKKVSVMTVKINHIKDRSFWLVWIYFNPLKTLPVLPLQAAWNLYKLWIGLKLTASEVISAQIGAERDTYPIGYSDFVLMEGATFKWARSRLISRIIHGEKFHENKNRSKIFTDRNRLFLQLQGKIWKLKIRPGVLSQVLRRTRQ